MLESNKKLYYSIKEVSEMTELKPYVLRYWESEFPSLKPSKNRAGNRTYKKQDIQVILDIKKLLYQKKFTIKGAVEELKNRFAEKDVNQEEKVIEHFTNLTYSKNLINKENLSDVK